MDILRKNVAALGSRCGRFEVEFGRAKRVHVRTRPLAPADAMVILQRLSSGAAAWLSGEPHVPARLPNTLPALALHQSLVDRKSRANAFTSHDDNEALSPIGRSFPGRPPGACAGRSAFATPTLNGYKRYQGVNTIGAVQAVWARDNRRRHGAGVGGVGDPATRLENRVGEPLANPYLYMRADLWGLTASPQARIGPSADAPYRVRNALPRTLEMRWPRCGRTTVFPRGLRRWLRRLLRPYQGGRDRTRPTERRRLSDPADVTEWEHREYFDGL